MPEFVSQVRGNTDAEAGLKRAVVDYVLDRMTSTREATEGEDFLKAASELPTYLTLNATALVNYSLRHRAGLRIATSGAESVVNSLVNARMNKRR